MASRNAIADRGFIIHTSTYPSKSGHACTFLPFIGLSLPQMFFRKRSALAACLLMVVSCRKGATESAASAPPVDVAALHLAFATIPAGTFQMGSESSFSPDQNPIHDVTI